MSKRIGVVRQEFVGDELAAISFLLQQWAKPEIVRKRHHEWIEKLPAIRRALLKGLSQDAQKSLVSTRGKRENDVDELVADEYEVVLETVKTVQLKLSKIRNHKLRLREICNGFTTNVEISPHQQIAFSRAFPAPRKLNSKPIEEVDWTRKSAALATEITAIRMDVTESKVALARNMIEYPVVRRAKGNRTQRILASCYLDLCFQFEQTQDLRREVLKALYQSGYHVLLLLYLVQTTATRERPLLPIFMGDIKSKELLSLCQAIKRCGEKGRNSDRALSEVMLNTAMDMHQ